MAKKYKVAPGCSFIGGGKSYEEGDEISASAFGEGEKAEKRFQSFLTGDKPKIIPAGEKEEKEPAKLTRPELEKIALDGKVEKKDFQSLKDDELEKLLKERGLIK
jgi:hypothetical protein